MSRPVAYFDGDGDYLTCGTIANFNFLHQNITQYSIGFYYKLQSLNAIQMLVATTTGATSERGMMMFINSDRTVDVTINRGVSGQSVLGAYTSGTVPNDTNWHYLLMTYDYTLASNNVTIYIDGSSIGTISKSAYAPSSVDSNYVLNIGRSPAADYYLTGYISDLIITQKYCQM